MTDEAPEQKVVETDGLLDALTSSTEMALTGLPAPILQNALTALKRLSVAVTDIPIAWLEGKAQEIRATSNSRVFLSSQVGKQIGESLGVPPEFAEAAALKYAQKIVGKQVNLNKVAEHAVEDLQKEKSADSQEDTGKLSEDWLNAFEVEAGNMSSEQMQRLFGRILAGEIRRPATFSMRTLKVIAQLDNKAARLFALLCSHAVSLVALPPLGVYDVRVLALGGNASSNALASFGLGFSELNLLQEYGLIITDFNSYMDYQAAVAVDRQLGAAMRFQGEWCCLKRSDGAARTELRLTGVRLTAAGQELSSVVESEPVDSYKQKLTSYFNSLGYTVEPAPSPL